MRIPKESANHCFYPFFDVFGNWKFVFFAYNFRFTYPNLMSHIPKYKSSFPLHDEKKVYIKIYTLSPTISIQTLILFFGAPGIIWINVIAPILLSTIENFIQNMEKLNFGYSIKNLPTPNEKTYRLHLLEKTKVLGMYFQKNLLLTKASF